jgi:vacuolar-type H+-ATPase catalytic subunit A/Vma1
MTHATVTQISKHATIHASLLDNDTAKLYELVLVGKDDLLGEVIKWNENTITILMFASTRAVKLGDDVRGTNKPVHISIGPGMIGNMYDALLSPYQPLQEELFFEPCVQEGDPVCEGTVYGHVPNLLDGKLIVMPELDRNAPMIKGTVAYIAKSGQYKRTDVLLIIRCSDNKEISFTMMQQLSVRVRLEKPKPEEPPVVLNTGIRVLDAFLPLVRGKAMAFLGNRATGKSTICQTICKNVTVDVIVFVSCGMRANETKQLSTSSFASKMVLVSAPLDTSPSYKYISLFTGSTVAEYYRELGLHVLLVFDSVFTWTEAYDRIFYTYIPRYVVWQNLPKVNLASNSYNGSVTSICTYSNHSFDYPSHQFSDYAFCVFLSEKLTRKRQYPAISLHEQQLKLMADISSDAATMRRILSTRTDLEELVMLVGWECLAEHDQIVYLMSQSVFTDHFLVQNFDLEPYSPEYLTCGMLRNISHFFSLILREEYKFQWKVTHKFTEALTLKIAQQKYLDVSKGREVVQNELDRLYDEITGLFQTQSIWEELCNIREKKYKVPVEQGKHALTHDQLCDVEIICVGVTNTRNTDVVKQLCQQYDDVDVDILHRLASRLMGTELEYLLDD